VNEFKRNFLVEWLPVAALRPDPRNPRLHSARQIKQIGRSIASFGFNVPLLVDRDNRVIAGHGRLAAARHLGLDEVPVLRLEHLSAAQAKAFAIADNRLCEIAAWDAKLLGEVFGELAALDLDFSLEATGFSMAEIDLTIEAAGRPAEAVPDPADQPVDVATGTPVSRVGDLWRLGRHRVLCGDATDQASYSALTQGDQAGAVFTDPPYNVAVNGHVSGQGAIRHREFPMASGEMSEAEFTRFLTIALGLLARHTSAGSIQYICMDWRHLRELLSAAAAASAEILNLCVWVKSNAGLGSFYRSQHELIVVCKTGTGPHRNNVELGKHGRHRTNVWTYPNVSSFGRPGEEGHLTALHPTPKPVAMIADALLDSSARGEIVLDPFLGIGSTLIAAERVGRIAYGIELDPLYVDATVRRWQRYGGEVAIHAATGDSFNDIAGRGEAGHG